MLLKYRIQLGMVRVCNDIGRVLQGGIDTLLKWAKYTNNVSHQILTNMEADLKR